MNVFESKRSFLKTASSLGLLTTGVALGGCAVDSNKNASAADNTEQLLQRGTIRAAYIVFPGYLMKDPNTGGFSGLSYEIIDNIGAHLNLKVEWTEEVMWGTAMEGFHSGRYDILGTFIWPNGGRLRTADFTIPFSYIGIYAYTTTENAARLMKHTDINNPDVAVVVIDGETSSIIANDFFPKARQVSLPASTDMTQVLEYLRTKKADVCFYEISALNDYVRQYPDAIRRVTPEPVLIMPLGFAVSPQLARLRLMMNGALLELTNNGTADRIIAKYERQQDEYLRLIKPYRLASA